MDSILKNLCKFNILSMQINVFITKEEAKGGTHAGLIVWACFSWTKAPARPPAPEFKYWIENKLNYMGLSEYMTKINNVIFVVVVVVKKPTFDQFNMCDYLNVHNKMNFGSPCSKKNK